MRGEATLAEAALKAAASLAKKNVAVVEAEAVDAVLGAAFLTASELGLPRAPKSRRRASSHPVLVLRRWSAARRTRNSKKRCSKRAKTCRARRGTRT